VSALDDPSSSVTLSGFKGYYEVLLEIGHAESDFFPSQAKEGGRTLVLYFADTLPFIQIEIQLELLLAALSISEYAISQRQVSASSYLTEYKKYFKPNPLGRRLLVLPAWESYSGDRLAIRIDPGLAFGTGLHDSTRLCLEWLESSICAGWSAIDAGCGSGILSAAALLLGASHVLAFDIESQAVLSARHNLKLNGVLDKARIVKSDLSILETEKADVVLANLTANILAGAARLFGVFNRMVLSGFIEDQEGRVRDLFKEHSVAGRATIGGWSLLHLERKPR
jgi:ribosomal protein L11 methyltransferase